ncbi:MAG TPA: hypothetical protein VFN31_02150 [Candidatus Saccharimonadales bacterium]|nr:hypothetical protein [Candidatus Saccharimonadales bacterium]
MKKLVLRLQSDYPGIRFKPGKEFCWSPETNEVVYNSAANTQEANWSLLHETGHALLKHKTYKADVALLRLEVEAWSQAKVLAERYDLEIGEDHIEDCLDTYRDWLYKRSICPNCNCKCLQESDYVHYRCFNCHTVWKVSPNRFCRAYRSTKNVSLNSPAIFI